MRQLIEALGAAIPDDHCRQVSLNQMAEAHVRGGARGPVVLDVGVGDGRAVDLFAAFDAGVVYYGVDIESSPEVQSRTRSDATFVTYDGVNVPFPEAMFDLVYSQQVFEHVRFPDALVAEIGRVLKPSGYFIGSVSFLEPYHSFSIFHWSPYGVYRVLSDAGLKVEWIRPGIDGATLIARTVSKRRQRFDRWFTKESPLNRLVAWRGKRRKRSAQQINADKLVTAGHIVFCARKA